MNPTEQTCLINGRGYLHPGCAPKVEFSACIHHGGLPKVEFNACAYYDGVPKVEFSACVHRGGVACIHHGGVLKAPVEFIACIHHGAVTKEESIACEHHSVVSTSELCPPPGGVDILFLLFSPSDVRRPASDVRRHAWFPLI